MWIIQTSQIKLVRHSPLKCDRHCSIVRNVLYICLTDFKQMFHLWKKQVDGFYLQNVGKTPVEEWHFK